QVQDVVNAVTQEAMAQAQMDMQQFQLALANAQKLNAGNIQAFTQEYKSDQKLLAAAQYPKDFAAVSNDASQASNALALLHSTYTQLAQFKDTIGQMKQAHIDVTSIQAQYQSDLATLNRITSPVDFSNLSS